MLSSDSFKKLYRNTMGWLHLDYMIKRIAFLIVLIVCSLGCNVKETVENGRDVLDFSISYWPFGNEKALCFTWDDGAPIHTRSIVSVFNKYNYRTTFFFITKKLSNGGSALLDEYRFAVESGHEVGSHTVSHLSLPELSLSDAKYQIQQSAIDLEGFLGYKPTSFAHPFRQMSNEIDEIVLKYYLSARFSTIQKYPRRKIRSLISEDSYSSLKNEFDSFLKDDYNRWIVYVGHGLSSEHIPSGLAYQPLDSIALDSFLGYVKGFDDKVWVTPFEDVIVYEIIRDNVSLFFEKGKVFVDTHSIDPILEEYPHPHAYLTLVVDNPSFTFESEGLESVRVEKDVAYVTLDLRKSKELFYR